MLNPFPELLTYGLLAPFLIRLFLGVVLVLMAVRHIAPKNAASAEEASGSRGMRTVLGVVEGAVGLALIVGFYTQVAAIVAALLAASYLASPKLRAMSTEHVGLKALLVMALSLLLTGAGAFAFDIPL